MTKFNDWNALSPTYVNLINKMSPTSSTIIAVYSGNVGGFTGGRTEDFGKTWQPINFMLQSMAREVDTDGSTWVASANENNISISKDDGRTWTRTTNLPTQVGLVRAVTVHGSNIIVAGDGGCARSTNLGASWALVTISTDITHIKMQGAIVIALHNGTAKRVYRSTNFGSSFSFSSPQYMKTPVSFDFQRSNAIFVDNEGNIFKSSNSGNTWTYDSHQGDDVITVGTNGKDVLFTTRFGEIYWVENIDYPFTTAPMRIHRDEVDAIIRLNSVRHDFAIAIRANIVNTQPPILWGSSVHGQLSGYKKGNLDLDLIFKARETTKRNDVGISVRSQDISNRYESVEYEHWYKQVQMWDCTSFNNTHMVAGNVSPFVYRSTDNGKTWQNTPIGSTNVSPYKILLTSELYALAVSRDGTTTAGIYRTINGGTSWTQTLVNQQGILDICYDPANSNICYLSGSYLGGYVYKSTNSGSTWVRLDNANDSLINGARTIAAYNNLVIVPYRAQLTNQNMILRSTNAGSTWTSIQLPITGSTPLDLSTRISGNTIIIVFQNGIVCRSTNAGLNWTIVPPVEGAPVNPNTQTTDFNNVTNSGNTWIMSIRGSRTRSMVISFDDGETWRTINERRDDIDSSTYNRLTDGISMTDKTLIEVGNYGIISHPKLLFTPTNYLSNNLDLSNLFQPI